MTRSWRCVFFIVIAACGWLPAKADLNVFPKSFFVNLPNRTASMTILNSGEQREEVWLDFRYGYPVANDSGRFYMIYGDSTSTVEPNAVPWLTAYPGRFALNPGESQVVKVMVKPPIGLISGEYLARVVISSQPVVSPTSKSLSQQVSSGVKLLTRLDLPLHVRAGSVGSGIKIHRVSAAVDSGWLKIGIDLSRLGNASYWGTMRFTVRDRDGRVVSTEKHPVAIYRDMVYPVRLNVRDLSTGTYEIEIVTDNKRPDIPVQYRVRADDDRYLYQCTIP